MRCRAGTWLLRRVPWTQAEHTVRARCADAVLAGLLGVAPGEACLVLQRRTWHLGAPGDRGGDYLCRRAPAFGWGGSRRRPRDGAWLAAGALICIVKSRRRRFSLASGG